MKNPFTIRKGRLVENNICAIYNKFFRVIKNSKGIYCYEFSNFSTMEFMTLYKGKKSKLVNKYTLYLVTFLFNVIGLPILFIMFPLYLYFDGAYNFIRDSAWYNNVRFFNWTNLVLLISLILYIIFR